MFVGYKAEALLKRKKEQPTLLPHLSIILHCHHEASNCTAPSFPQLDLLLNSSEAALLQPVSITLHFKERGRKERTVTF